MQNTCCQKEFRGRSESPVCKTAAEKSAAAEPALIGSYLAVKETNFSIIRVIVTTENGKITGCRILSEAKSEGSDFLTDQIREDWAKAIVKSGSAETEGSGAAPEPSSGAAALASEASFAGQSSVAATAGSSSLAGAPPTPSTWRPSW